MKLGRIAAVVAVAAVVGMWAFISRTGQEDPLDQLDDPSFAETAERLCDATMDEVEPPLAATRSRADQIEQANARLRRLVDELAAQAPEEGDGAGLVGEWLDDWETLPADTATYVRALRERGEEAEFLVTDRAGRQDHRHHGAFRRDQRHARLCPAERRLETLSSNSPVLPPKPVTAMR